MQAVRELPRIVDTDNQGDARFDPLLDDNMKEPCASPHDWAACVLTSVARMPRITFASRTQVVPPSLHSSDVGALHGAVDPGALVEYARGMALQQHARYTAVRGRDICLVLRSCRHTAVGSLVVDLQMHRPDVDPAEPAGHRDCERSGFQQPKQPPLLMAAAPTYGTT